MHVNSVNILTPISRIEDRMVGDLIVFNAFIGLSTFSFIMSISSVAVA